MHKTTRLALFNMWQLMLDLIFLLFSFMASYTIARNFTKLRGVEEYLWILIIFIPLWMSMMAMLGMYNSNTFNFHGRIFRYIVASTLVSGTIVAAVMYSLKETRFSRLFFNCFLVCCIIVMLILRYSLVRILKKYPETMAKKVLVIGVTELYEKFLNYIDKTSLNINIQEYIPVDGEESLFDHAILRDPDNLKEILKKYVFDEVIFILPKKYISEIEKYICICEEMGITIRIIFDLFDLRYSKIHVSSLGALPMITFHSVPLNSVELFIKRTIDIIGAMVGIALTGWVAILTAIAIKLDSPGPVFFVQDRVGLNGRVFKLYKFRSMHIDAEVRKKELTAQNQVKGGFMFKVKDDPRITSVGKFIRKTSIDEIPQFINVLKGDMSLVGTRPPTLDEVSRYEHYHCRRISIKPGITGLWQVSGRSRITDFEQVVKLDTRYIDEWSVLMDVKIMLKTVLVLFRSEGAY